MSVAVDRARRLLRECAGQPELLLSAKRVRKLRKIALLPDGKEYLAAIREYYEENRRRWGFKT